MSIPALTAAQVEWSRRQFPALSRQIAGHDAVFLDGPAGTQVPQRVIDAVATYFRDCNANHGGLFPTSRESDALLDEAHRAASEFVGSDDPGEIAFGPNMTTLTLGLSRALGRTWKTGDEIIVTQLDHDANYSPWVLAARDAGATVKVVPVRKDDCTLDLDQFTSMLSARTRLVAVGCASNSVGTINPVREIIRLAHGVGALVFLDAVHSAPHQLVDVRAWDCDFLACSAYKFFGPHTGILWGRRQLLEKLPAYKLRPAPDSLPGKWMTGTQSHELIVGVRAAIDYLADLGQMVAAEAGQTTADLGRRSALVAAYSAVTSYERSLAQRLWRGLREVPGLRIWGIDEPARINERVATFAVTHSQHSAPELAAALGDAGIFVWHGNYYALNLSEALGREPEGMVRIGLVHYNTPAEVDRFLDTLRHLLR